MLLFFMINYDSGSRRVEKKGNQIVLYVGPLVD